MPSLDTDDLKTRARFFIDEATREGRAALEEVITPGFVEDKLEGVTRVGQVVSFLFIGPIVVVSLQLIVVLNQLMTDILGVQPLGAGQDPIFAWLVTGLTGGFVVLAAWFWFQFVRTAGFGYFHMQET